MKLTVWPQNEWILPRMSIKEVALRSLHLDQIGVVGRGEAAGSSRVPCCQHQDCLFIQTTNQLIPEFLYSLCFCGTLDLFGFGGEDPSLQMSGYGLCDLVPLPPSQR